MALVNIPRSQDDPNYRYKMPKLTCRIEGRGNGIKTNIYNMGAIANCLKRPPMYPTKFFGCELGTQAQYWDAEEKAIVNGAHTESKLDEVLDKFVAMYVLCPLCSLPETDIYVKKKDLCFRCNACGGSGLLDNSHRAVAYMVKNPPKQEISTMGHKTKDRATTKGKAKTTPEEEKEKEKDKEKKKEKKQASEAKEKVEAEKSKKAGKKKSSDGKGDDVERSFDSDEINEVITRMQNFVKLEDLSPQKFFEELRILQVSRNFDATCRMYVVFETLFSGKLDAEEVNKKIPYLKKVLDSSTTYKVILRALEAVMKMKGDENMRNFPFILHALYDNWILDGQDIIKYFKKGYGDPTCAIQVEPFLAWLSELSEEEEEVEQSPSPMVTKCLKKEPKTLPLFEEQEMPLCTNESIVVSSVEPVDDAKREIDFNIEDI